MTFTWWEMVGAAMFGTVLGASFTYIWLHRHLVGTLNAEHKSYGQTINQERDAHLKAIDDIKRGHHLEMDKLIQEAEVKQTQMRNTIADLQQKQEKDRALIKDTYDLFEQHLGLDAPPF